jgi:hypothetical protein
LLKQTKHFCIHDLFHLPFNVCNVVTHPRC